MTLRTLDIGIVGCGFAGSAAALFLSRAGHRVTAYEAVDDPSAVGAGIMLQPSGMAVLHELDLLEPVLDRGDRVERLRTMTRQGRTLLNLPYAALGDELFGLGLHRGVLFETMFKRAQEERVDVRTGVRIVSMTHGARVTLRDDHDRVHGPHDLIVVADGARSQVRQRYAPWASQSQYPWGALWFIGRDDAGEFDGELFQRVDGAQQMVGLLPTGKAPSSLGDDDNLVSLFVSVRSDRVGEIRARGVEAFRDRVVDLCPRAAPVVAQIDDLDQVLFASYWDIVMPRWHDDARVIYIGDAAHATSPQLGQGSNLALCDAQTLSDSLAQSNTIVRALRRYQRLRHEQLAFYQRATRWLTPFFQHDSRALGMMRDLAMPIATRVPWTRREMVRSMCGDKRGFLLPGF